MELENRFENKIPKGWKYWEIGELGNVSTGSTPPTRDKSNYGDKYLFVSPADLGSRKWIKKTHKKLSEKGFRISRIFPKNSILFVCIGSTIGKSGIASVDLTSNQQINAIVPSSNFSSQFIYYAVNAISDQIKSQAGEQAVPMVNKTEFSLFQIPLPPTLAEQKAIAAALSDVDDLISSLDALIAKKKAIKQGAMQQLLTPPHKGGKRLDGFDGEWVEKPIKEIVSSPVTDGPHETPKFVRIGVPFLSVNNIVNNKINKSNLRHISTNDDLTYSKKCKPRKKDILLGKAASVGKVAIVEDDWDFNIWSPLALIRVSENFEPHYIFYFFQTYHMLRQIDFLTNSSSQGNIGMGDIEKLNIYSPLNIDEQKAIAQILSDMDKELDELATKKDKYVHIKRGMMQELLTGKKRLV